MREVLGGNVSFWGWFGRWRRASRAEALSTLETAPPVAAPPVDPVADLEEDMRTGPLETESTRPMTPMAAPPRPAPRAAAGWPSREEIASLADGQDAAAVARVIGQRSPNAGADEVLFRYHLSRAVWFGEHDLPALPQSAMRVLELSRSPKAGVADYAKVVEADPGMVKSVLWLANSSFFASLARCSSLPQAMVRIGTREVERLAMMQAFQARVFRVHGQDDLVRDLGRHGLATALSAQAVARRTGGVNPGDAFLAGLFHDVGKLVVLGVVAQVQRKLRRRAPKALIGSAFDAFHVVVGESATRHWCLPDPLAAAVARHHDAAAAAGDPLDRAVWLGNVIAHLAADPKPEDAAGRLEGAAALLDAARLGPADVATLADQARTDLREYQRLVP